MDIRTNSPAIFYFGQIFAFCMLTVNKNVLEWFLLITCKELTLTRSTNLFSRNHLACFLWRREGRQMSNTEQLLYQNDKSSHQRCSIKKAVLNNFAIFIGKHLCWSIYLIKLHTLMYTYFEEHLRTAASELTLGSDCLGLCFLKRHFTMLYCYPIVLLLYYIYYYIIFYFATFLKWIKFLLKQL